MSSKRRRSGGVRANKKGAFKPAPFVIYFNFLSRLRALTADRFADPLRGLSGDVASTPEQNRPAANGGDVQFFAVGDGLRGVDGDAAGRDKEIAEREFVARLVARFVSQKLAGVLLAARDRHPFAAVADIVREVVGEHCGLIFGVIVGQEDDVNFGELQAFAEDEAEGEGDRDGENRGGRQSGKHGERRGAGETDEEFDARSGPHLRAFQLESSELGRGSFVGADDFRAVFISLRRFGNVVQVADRHAVENDFRCRVGFFQLGFVQPDDAALHDDDARRQPKRMMPVMATNASAANFTSGAALGKYSVK